MQNKQPLYFVPEPSKWPLVGSMALLGIGMGSAFTFNRDAMPVGPYILAVGLALLAWMLVGWFGEVIHESESGQYSRQVDRSFRWGMSWFIFSEVMFFAAFFGALFYMRVISLPDLSEGLQAMIWPDFHPAWPEVTGPHLTYGADNYKHMHAFGLPALNTLILLISGVTVTWAHWGLVENKRGQLNLGLLLTVALGVLFLCLQFSEYREAFHEMNLTLKSGAYGATFYLLTGFHGLHVTLGTLMLFVVMLRAFKGHFKPESHFAFEAVAWYWHFVDVVWLILFVFVYWL